MLSSCSDFCTATRNYAKRQLNWYRKDKNFLFVRSRRHFVGKKERADSKTADEVYHWASASRADFDAAVTQQLEVADALAELRQPLSGRDRLIAQRRDEPAPPLVDRRWPAFG